MQTTEPFTEPLQAFLKFLAANSETQIRLAVGLMPRSAIENEESLDDVQRYDLLNGQLDALPRLKYSLESSWTGFVFQFHPQYSTVNELIACLELMLADSQTVAAKTKFWNQAAIRSATEWKTVRRIARIAIQQLQFPQKTTLPTLDVLFQLYE